MNNNNLNSRLEIFTNHINDNLESLKSDFSNQELDSNIEAILKQLEASVNAIKQYADKAKRAAYSDVFVDSQPQKANQKPFIRPRTALTDVITFSDEMRGITSKHFNSHNEKIEAIAKLLIDSGANPLDYKIITRREDDGTFASWAEKIS